MATKIELIRAENLDEEFRKQENITIDRGTIALQLTTGSVNREYKQISGKFFDFLRKNAKQDGQLE